MHAGAPAGNGDIGVSSRAMVLVGEIDRLLDALGEVDPSELTGEELAQVVPALQRQGGRHAAQRARFAAAWCAERVWADDGSKSAGARLAREANISATQGRVEVRRARKLRAMPHVAEAFAAGDLSAEHVDVLGRCNVGGYQDLFARDEQLLVADATGLRFPDFVKAVNHWLLLADSFVSRDRAEREHDRRRCHASRTFQGTVDLTALFDRINGEIFLNELDRLERRLFEVDWADAKERATGKVTVDDLARTPGQRRLDALVEMARRSASAPPGSKPARPLFTILCGLDTFKQAVCETDHGVVLDARQLLPYLTEADVERVVFGPGSRALDVGKRRRFFKGATRRAVEVRDRHCTDPSGCDVPAPDCDVDHTIPYEHGGETTQLNGELRCGCHNRARNHRRPKPPSPEP